MKKVILNKCYGGFDVSDKGYQLYAKKKGLELFRYEMVLNNSHSDWQYRKLGKDEEQNGLTVNYFTKDLGDIVEISDENWNKYSLCLRDNHREDSILIEVIEELGEEASGRFGNLVVVEIPDDLDYVIDEYDGIETLHERVQEW